MAAAPQGALASSDGTKMAVLPDGELAALQSLLKAPSRDAVRQLCRECFSSPATDLGPLAQRACLSFATGPEQAEQLVSALHNLTRHVVYCGLTEAEDILSLFPENFHQNLKNLLTKIILENMKLDAVLLNTESIAQLFSENELKNMQEDSDSYKCDGTPVEMTLISLPRLVDMDWRVDIKTSSDSISGMAVPTCLLQLKIQEDVALCGNSPVVSALTLELSKETLDTMLEGLGRIRDQLSAVANK